MTLRADRGSATLYVLAFVALLSFVGAAVVVIAAGMAAHRQAAAAADLAALAAAHHVSDTSAACTVAAEVAAANRAQLEECQVSGLSVLVTVAVDPRLGWLPTMRVAARAGQAFAPTT